MALDILPLTAAGGGHDRVFHFRAAASSTFERGQLLVVDADGEVDEHGAGAVTLDRTLHYIALEDFTESGNVLDRGGSSTITNSPYDGRNLITCAPIDEQTEFVTRHVFATGSGVDIGPAAGTATFTATVGDTMGLRVGTGGEHGIEEAATGVYITRLLNSLGQDIALTGEAVAAVDKVVFRSDV